MVIDGEKTKRVLLEKIKKQVREVGYGMHLAFLTFDNKPSTQEYIAQLKKYADSVGIKIQVEHIPSSKHNTEDTLHTVLRVTKDYGAVCVELPIPHSIDSSAVQKIFPLSHDVMLFGDTALKQFQEQRLPFAPPVVDAFKVIVEQISLHVAGLRVTVLGNGRTIGLPMVYWLEQLGAIVSVVDSDEDIEKSVQDAHVVVAGLGNTHVVKPDMLTGKPVLIDIGVQELSNTGAGDIDPTCVDAASIFVPAVEVMQPLCQLMILQNMFAVMQLQQRQHMTHVRIKKK